MKKEESISSNDMELLMRAHDRSPVLFNRVMELLQIVYNEPEMRTADDTEFSVIDNLRQMGKEALTSWGSASAANATSKTLGQDSALKRAGKKKSTGKRPMER